MIARIRSLPGGVVLFLCLNFANVSNYLYQVAMGRLLGHASYGLLGSVVQLINVITVSSLALQTASARVIASSGEKRVPLAHPWDDPLTRAAVMWGAALTMILLAATPFVSLFLHTSIGPSLAIPAVVIPAALLAIGQGRLQGLNALHAFALLAVVVALLRLLIGPIAVLLHTGVTGAGIALSVAATLGAMWAVWITRRAGPVDARAARSDIGRGALAFVIFWLMASADIVVARHFLSANTAGQYAVASVVGKAVIWFPSAVAIAIFPRVAQTHAEANSARSATSTILIKGLGLTVGLGVVTVAGLRVLGPTVIPLFFGHSYQPAATLAWEVGLACVPFAAANLLIYYQLAVGQAWLMAALVAGVVAEVAAVSLLHDSSTNIALSLGIGGAVLCIALVAVDLPAILGGATSGLSPEPQMPLLADDATVSASR